MVEPALGLREFCTCPLLGCALYGLSIFQDIKFAVLCSSAQKKRSSEIYHNLISASSKGKALLFLKYRKVMKFVNS